MASPFPGMDPFIESQAWEDFHAELVTDLRAWLTPHLQPRYVVRVEERVYIEHVGGERPRVGRADVADLGRGGDCSPVQQNGGRTAVAVAPVILTLTMPERVREVFLTVRDRETLSVVTVIELLSPGNKRAGSDGRREYLAKREAILQSEAHLVELDLLRGGERLPTLEPLPSGDYYAFVARAEQRPAAEVYGWSLRQPLPPLEVPLAPGDRDLTLDLQAVFGTAYERAGYRYSLDYGREVEPQLPAEDAAWVRELLIAEVPDLR